MTSGQDLYVNVTYLYFKIQHTKNVIFYASSLPLKSEDCYYLISSSRVPENREMNACELFQFFIRLTKFFQFQF